MEQKEQSLVTFEAKETHDGSLIDQSDLVDNAP